MAGLAGMFGGRTRRGVCKVNVGGGGDEGRGDRRGEGKEEGHMRQTTRCVDTFWTLKRNGDY